MCITIYSLMMACIWTSVLAAVMCVIQKNKRTLQYFGINNMLILYGFCVIRMIVPVEIPITKVVPVEAVYNAMTHLCRNVLIGGRFQAGCVLLVIWGCGTVIKLCLLIRDYRTTKRALHACTVKKEGTACELLKKLQEEQRDQRKIQVYATPYAVPMEIGILHPAILLPDKEYPERDLYYIMKHEYTHILNHDTTVKLLLNLWSCIFWWNPVTYLLRGDMENTLELKCDLTVAGELGKEKRAEYLSAILHVIQNVTEENGREYLPKNINALYKVHSQEETLKRFRCVSECSEMTEKAKVKYRGYIAVMFVVYMIIFCASYGFVFQSRFDPPTDEVITEEGIYELRPETVFLREKGDMYEVIYENKCVDVIEKDVALLMLEEGFQIWGRENYEN